MHYHISAAGKPVNYTGQPANYPAMDFASVEVITFDTETAARLFLDSHGAELNLNNGKVTACTGIGYHGEYAQETVN